MSSVFAVCDIETDYAIRFMEFLNRRNLPFCELQMFTAVDALCEFAGKKHIDLLLISERAMCDEVRNLKVGKMILLSEGNHTEAESDPELSAVYKYQSSAQVVREVLDCYSAEKIAAQAAADIRKRQGKVYGVYSLSDPMRQMLFTLALGQILAETQTVLYVNLQKHSGLTNLTEEEAELTLSDLLFFYRQKKQGLLYRLPGMTRQIGQLDYIPVPFFSEDLGELSGEEWKGFLEKLRNAGTQDVLLLDLSDGLRGLPDILDCCTDLIFLSEEDPFSMEKRKLLEKELALPDGVRLQWLSPPPAEEIREGRWFLESLPDSNLGEYIRKVVHPDERA